MMALGGGDRTSGGQNLGNATVQDLISADAQHLAWQAAYWNVEWQCKEML